MVKLKDLKGTDNRVNVFIVTLNDGNAYYQSETKVSPNRGDAKVFTSLSAAERIAARNERFVSAVVKV